MPFVCSICGEAATQICARCTKDACGNHLCEKCLRCSDCCECEVALREATQAPVPVVRDLANAHAEADAQAATPGEPPPSNESDSGSGIPGPEY